MKVAENYSHNEIVDLSQYFTSTQGYLDRFIDEVYRCSPIRDFKAAFSEVAKASRENTNVDFHLTQRTQSAFRKVLAYVNNVLYHTPRYTPEQKETIGEWIHQEFISFCLLGTWPSRSLNKPQNIAGDHHTIRQIYKNGDQDHSDIGQVVNYCFFEEPACKAVKNRKNYIQKRILDKIHENDEETRIASIASGPAEEIFDVYEILGKENRQKLRAVGIDIDKRACASVDDRIYENRLNNYFSTHASNILKLSTLQSNMFNQDLVYSMGLIDYFKDKATIKILNTIYKMLKPGGEVVVGNFHESCESRIFLDYLLDWKLIYRTEEDMHRLFHQSDFNGCPVTVDFEEEGVNMLARCKKI